MSDEKISWSELRALIREDAEAAFARDPSAGSVSDVTRFSVGFRIVRAYRRQHWLYARGHRTLALWLAKRSRIRYGADIHPAAKIGRRFTVDHGIGVVVGGTAIIGDDCLMYQNATLGMTASTAASATPRSATACSWAPAPSCSAPSPSATGPASAPARSSSTTCPPTPPSWATRPAWVRTHVCPLVSDMVRVTDDFGKSWVMEA